MCFQTYTKKQEKMHQIQACMDSIDLMMDTAFDISDTWNEDDYIVICNNLQVQMDYIKRIEASMTDPIHWLKINLSGNTESFYEEADARIQSINRTIMVGFGYPDFPSANHFKHLLTIDLKWCKEMNKLNQLPGVSVVSRDIGNSMYIIVYGGDSEGMYDTRIRTPPRMTLKEVLWMHEVDRRSPQRPRIHWRMDGESHYSILPEYVPDYYCGTDRIVNGIAYQKVGDEWFSNATGDFVPVELLGQP